MNIEILDTKVILWFEKPTVKGPVTFAGENSTRS